MDTESIPVPIIPYDFDDDLIEAVRADPRARVRVYPFRMTAVVLGRGSRPDQEVWLDRITADRIPLLRRRGGGCAVVLDTGNAIVSLVHPKKGFGGGRKEFNGISQWLIAALATMGYHVVQKGISDLTMGDRKIGGSCIYRPLGLLYYTTTLLVSPRIDLSTRYLKHPPREPAYRRGRPHAEFMGALADAKPVEMSAFVSALNAALSARSPIDGSPMRLETLVPRTRR